MSSRDQGAIPGFCSRVLCAGLDSDSTVFDKVIVRDLVLGCHIGVLGMEKNVTQRVRFSVELEVFARAEPLSDDIAGVVSYDFIVDGIREIVAEGHTLLTETLAERIAEHCLSDWRAAGVRVLVEKLDRIPGAALGVEIYRRQRAAREANGAS